MAPALRTQIYLSREQRRALDEISRSEGASLAELIRVAVDEFLDGRPRDVDAALTESFGAVPEAAAPPRSEWASREQRVGAG